MHKEALGSCFCNLPNSYLFTQLKRPKENRATIEKWLYIKYYILFISFAKRRSVLELEEATSNVT